MAVPTRSPSTWLRTNGDDFKVVDEFPFMLRVSKHCEPFLATLFFYPSYFFRLRQSVEASIPSTAAASSNVAVRATTRVMCSRSTASKEKSPPTWGASAARWRAAMCAGKASGSMI